MEVNVKEEINDENLVIKNNFDEEDEQQETILKRNFGRRSYGLIR